MREQLALLRQLQDHDAQVQEILTTLHSLPAKLQDAKRALTELERRLLRDRAVLADNETLLVSQEEDKKKIAQQIMKSKSKLSQVRNVKESNATQRELEVNRRLLDAREEESKQLTQLIADQKKKLEAEEVKLRRYLDDLSQQESAVEMKLEKMKEESHRTKAERDLLAGQIDPMVLRRYESVRTLKKWPVVVSAAQGVCAGCHMRIFPQVYNNLYKTDSFESCAHCNRILFLPEDLDKKG